MLLLLFLDPVLALLQALLQAPLLVLDPVLLLLALLQLLRSRLRDCYCHYSGCRWEAGKETSGAWAARAKRAACVSERDRPRRCQASPPVSVTGGERREEGGVRCSLGLSLCLCQLRVSGRPLVSGHWACAGDRAGWTEYRRTAVVLCKFCRRPSFLGGGWPLAGCWLGGGWLF